MAKYRIAIARICVNGSHRQELTNFTTEAERYAMADVRIEGNALIHIPIARTPTPVARNLLVKKAREQQVDILFMLDDDMRLDVNFFQAALDFLLAHEGPAAIGVPYCTAPPEEKVNVFEWATSESGTPSFVFGIEPITREDSVRRTGIERVLNLGTGGIAYKLTCFDKINHPYYDYSYEDQEHTKVIETEDCYCHHKLNDAGVPLYVHWNFWADHYKMKRVGKPTILTDKHVGEIMMRNARAEVAMQGRELAALIPKDVEGWCDFADVYENAVKAAPSGGKLVEVGSYQGQSAILMARLIQRSGKPLRFTCVDHFGGSDEHTSRQRADLRAKFDANLEKYGVAHTIQVLPMASVEAAATFADESLDFVFLDASHDEENVRQDIEAWLPKVKPGGILAGHDFDFFGVCRAVAAMLPCEQVPVMGRSWTYRKPKDGEVVPASARLGSRANLVQQLANGEER